MAAGVWPVFDDGWTTGVVRPPCCSSAAVPWGLVAGGCPPSVADGVAAGAAAAGGSSSDLRIFTASFGIQTNELYMLMRYHSPLCPSTINVCPFLTNPLGSEDAEGSVRALVIGAMTSTSSFRPGAREKKENSKKRDKARTLQVHRGLVDNRDVIYLKPYFVFSGTTICRTSLRPGQ